MKKEKKNLKKQDGVFLSKKVVISIVAAVVLIGLSFGLWTMASNNNANKTENNNGRSEKIEVKSNKVVTEKVQPKKK